MKARNITFEAMKLAERDLIMRFPQLADKEFRKNLPREEKEFVFIQLVTLGSIYEEQLLHNL
jgi:hypothetical protein